MKSQRLPEELIDDFKSNVRITDLCRKYELTYQTVKNQLIKMGLSEKSIWGGRREGCGKKRIDRNSELQRIRERNLKTPFAKQPEGTLANPKSDVWRTTRKYSNDLYKGGF